MSTLPVPKTSPYDPPAPQGPPVACTVVTLDREVVIPAGVHTLAGFRAWAKSEDFPECSRVAFLDGELYIDMSPEEIETHNKVKNGVGFGITKFNKRFKFGESFPGRTLLTNEAANLSMSLTARSSPGKASRPTGYASPPGKERRANTLRWSARPIGFWRS